VNQLVPALVLVALVTPSVAAAGGLGAVGPNLGTTELELGGGVLLVLPHGTVAARAGTGGGSSLEVRYTNIGLLGHSLDGRLAWGGPVADGLSMGAALRTGLATLEQANDVAGIAWNNLAVGNDWVAGADLVATWARPGAADITVELGATMTIGGPRYQTFSAAEYRLEPGLRGIDAMVQGEWDLRADKRLFIRLRGFTPLHTGLKPLGFLPTASGGVSWRF
jgi:hypothetical protein